MKLKPARGKRIALRVSNKVPYTVIFSKAIEKWKVYQSQLYTEEEEEEEYLLVYEDGNKPNFFQELSNFSAFQGIMKKLEKTTVKTHI